MGVVIGVIVGLVTLTILVIVHELGHAIVARRNGVVVKEFGIGFPPKAWLKKPKQSFLGKNVEFSINWLPLGGFVRLQGEYDSANQKGDYGAASFWVKTKILLAGVTMNFLTAALILSILAVLGLPKILNNQIQLKFDTRIEKSAVMAVRVTANSPAQKAGIAVDDQIQRINGVEIKSPNQLIELTKSHAGQEVAVDFVRSGSHQQVKVKLNSTEEAKTCGYLGVAPSQTEKTYSTWSAPIVGVALTGQLSYETIKGVGDLLVKSVGGFIGQFFGSDESRKAARADLAAAGENVAGPIGILGVIFPSVVNSGLTQILLLAAIISLTLAVMNILPIPALDGGRWFTMIIFRLFKKPLTKEREENIQAVGMAILLILMIVVTVSDVGKIF